MRAVGAWNTVIILLAVGLCVSCSGGGKIDGVKGTVTVDGAPVEAGTISLRADGGAAPPAGGAINAGQFTVSSRKPLPSGTYTVAVQASKKTGRTVKDPQRGDVEELQPMELADSPQQVQLTAENASNLALSFKSGRR
jgi:hypothetical protein